MCDIKSQGMRMLAFFICVQSLCFEIILQKEKE